MQIRSNLFQIYSFFFLAFSFFFGLVNSWPSYYYLLSFPKQNYLFMFNFSLKTEAEPPQVFFFYSRQMSNVKPFSYDLSLFLIMKFTEVKPEFFNCNYYQFHPMECGISNVKCKSCKSITSLLTSFLQVEAVPVFSIKEGVLKNVGAFTGKHLCQSLFF